MGKNKREKTKKKASFLSYQRPENYLKRRFFALLIDFVIVSFLALLVFSILGKPGWDSYLEMAEVVKGLPKSDPLVAERMILYQECMFTTMAVCLVYESVFLLTTQATIGKMIFGLKIADFQEGRNPWLSKLFLILRAMIRVVSLYLLSAVPFIFLCLTVYGNADVRSGFDLFTGTRVLMKDRRKS